MLCMFVEQRLVLIILKGEQLREEQSSVAALSFFLSPLGFRKLLASIQTLKCNRAGLNYRSVSSFAS